MERTAKEQEKSTCREDIVWERGSGQRWGVFAFSNVIQPSSINGKGEKQWEQGGSIDQHRWSNHWGMMACMWPNKSFDPSKDDSQVGLYNVSVLEWGGDQIKAISSWMWEEAGRPKKKREEGQNGGRDREAHYELRSGYWKRNIYTSTRFLRTCTSFGIRTENNTLPSCRVFCDSKVPSVISILIMRL